MGYGGNGLVFSKGRVKAIYASEGEPSNDLPHSLDGNYYMCDEHGNVLNFEE